MYDLELNEEDDDETMMLSALLRAFLIRAF
jgi:hypothetical protein